MIERTKNVRLTRNQVLPTLGAVVGAAIAALIALLSPASHTASSAIMIVPSTTEGTAPSDTAALETTIQNRMPSLYYLATTPAVLQPVVSKAPHAMSAPDLASRMRVEYPPLSTILEITIEADTSETAVALTNATTATLKDVIHSAFSTREEGSTAVRVIELNSAETNVGIRRASIPLYALVGATLGFALAYSARWIARTPTANPSPSRGIET